MKYRVIVRSRSSLALNGGDGSCCSECSATGGHCHGGADSIPFGWSWPPQSELGGELGAPKLSPAAIRSAWLAAGGGDRMITTNVGQTVPLSALMTAIAMAESNQGDPAAINPGWGPDGPTQEYSVGLWQINTLVHKNYSVSQLKDPAINAREAVRIYNSQGLNAWYTTYFRLKSYRQFLPAALAASGGVSAVASASCSASSPQFCTPEEFEYCSAFPDDCNWTNDTAAESGIPLALAAIIGLALLA